MGSRVFLQPLPDETTGDELRSVIKEVGNVVFSKVIKIRPDEEEHHTFGIVEMSSPAEAHRVAEQFEDGSLTNRLRDLIRSKIRSEKTPEWINRAHCNRHERRKKKQMLA